MAASTKTETSTKTKTKNHKSRALLIACIALLGVSTYAERAQAQGRARPAVAARPAKAKAVVRAALPAASNKFRPGRVGPALKAALRGKTLFVAPKKRTAEYQRVMKNSIEILFTPRASEYGHLLIRVGERLYDMPGPSGARNQKFSDAMRFVNSAGYGFVYARTSEQVASLQREFESMASAGHGFAIAGAGPTKFSCASFITSVLAKHAPELKIGLSIGAIGAASRLLRNGSHDAVTLYGQAAHQAASMDFTFEKL